MELAAALHHSSFRGAGPETYDAPRSQMTANYREDSVYFDLYDEYTEGARPDRLVGVKPQERDQRRTVEQIIDTALFVPSLDVPVPQMENQLLEVCRQLDTPIPEQVIEVPKISSSRQSPKRRVRFAEQTAEQLVEVPTIISYSSLRGIVEQNVDIPVPRGRVGGGLLGLHPGQSSTAFGGARHFPAATAEQIVDTPVPRGGRVLHPASSSSVLLGTANQGGVFALFPEGKKCDVGLALGVGTGCGHQLIHAGGSSGGFLRGRSRCVDAVSWWLVETSGLGPRSLAAWVKAGTGPSSCVSLRELLEAFPDLLCSCSSHLESVHYFSVPVVAKIGFSGDDFLRGGNAWCNSGYMLCVSTSRALEEFTHFLRGGGLHF